MNWELKTDTDRLRKRIWEHLLKSGPRTAEEVGRDLGKSYRSVQPRISELHTDLRLVLPTDSRRGGVEAQEAVVWQALPEPYPAPPKQVDLFG